jgi:hypothetical protein
MNMAFTKHLKNRLTYTNAYYYPLQNHLSSYIPSICVNITLCKTIIFPCTFQGCKTWSLTLREEQDCEQDVEDNVWDYEEGSNRGLENLQTEELKNLHSSPNIIRMIKPRMRWLRYVVHKVQHIQGKPEEKSPPRRPMNRQIVSYYNVTCHRHSQKVNTSVLLSCLMLANTISAKTWSLYNVTVLTQAVSGEILFHRPPSYICSICRHFKLRKNEN